MASPARGSLARLAPRRTRRRGGLRRTHDSPALRWLLVQVRAAGLPEPVLEHRFHATRRWRFDVAWPDVKVCVELEGGTDARTYGRHVRKAGYEADCIKYNEAALAGWCVLRVTTAMCDDGRALRLIERALSE